MGFPKLVRCVDDEDTAYAKDFKLVQGYEYIATGVHPSGDYAFEGSDWSWRQDRFVVVEEDYGVIPQEEYTGASVSYYAAEVTQPTNPDAEPYTAECNDIIEALGMTFAEGNAFKAIWRSCAARKFGKAKKGYDNGLYDAEKVVFFGQRMVVCAKSAVEPEEEGHEAGNR